MEYFYKKRYTNRRKGGKRIVKKIIPPLFVYLAVCLLTVFLPASDGYNTIGWKLFVGQLYAIPALLMAILIMFFVFRRPSHN